MPRDLLAQPPRDLLAGAPKDLLAQSSSPFSGLAQFETASGMMPSENTVLEPAAKTFTNKSLQQMADEDASVIPTSRPFDSNITPAEASQNIAIGADFLSAPGNFIPLPIAEGLGAIAKPLGGLLEKFTPNVAKGTANQVRNFNPEWNARLNTPPAALKLPQDQTVQYQQWLQQNAQSSTPESPLMGVPLHPAEEGRAALAQIPVELPNQDGQLGFRDFPQPPPTAPVHANTADYLAAIEKYQAALNKPADQGQQEFDFTQGPTTTEVSTPSAPVAPSEQAASFPTSSPTPPWLKEALARIEQERNIPKTSFIEQDLNNPSVVKAIKVDPTLNEVQKSAILNTRTEGSLDDVLGKPPSSILPRELQGAKPRYNIQDRSYLPQFNSDTDKALYITAQKTPSKSDAAYRSFLKNQGFSDTEIAQHGKLIRDNVKAQAKNIKGGNVYNPQPLNIPSSGVRPGSLLKEVPTKTIVQPTAEEVPQMRQLPNKQMVLSDVINRKTLKPSPEVSPIEEPSTAPWPESPAQQQIDFTAGPSLPDTLLELRRLALTAPEEELPAIQAKIRDMVVPDKSKGIIQESPMTQPEEAPSEPLIEEPKVTKTSKMTSDERALSAEKQKIFNQTEDWTPQQEARLKEIDRLLSKKTPSPLEDIKTIVKAANKRVGKKGAVGNLGPKTPMSAEERAALDRWKTVHGPAILKDFTSRGENAAKWVGRVYPQSTPAEKALMIQGLNEMKTGNKVGNFNLKQYPKAQQAKIKELFAGKEAKLETKSMTHAQIVDKAKGLSSYPITEPILRSSEGQLAAEKVGREMTHIAKMQAIAEDPKLSAQDIVKRMQELDTQSIKKIRTETGRALNSGNIPLEAHQDKLVAFRKIIDRLRDDPTLTKRSSQALIQQLKTQFPEAKNATTVAEVFKEIYRNSITSSPVTWGLNALSNYGNIAARTPMRALEITADKIISKLGGNPTSSTYKEVGAMLKGMSDALGGKQLPEHLKSKTFTDKYKSSPLDILAANAKTKGGQQALDVTSKIVHTPSSVMQAADEHAKNILGMMEMEASKARGEDVFSDQHAIDRITTSQARGSFQDEMSVLGEAVANARNFFARKEPTALNQAGDMLTYALQPFIQTVDRIIAKGINTSVLGAGATAIKGMSGKYTGALAKGISHDVMAKEKLSRDLAAIMIGTPLFAWTWSQFAKGNIVGAAPQDTAGREAMGNTGKQEYSIKIGKRWVPLRYAPEPAATAVQINLALLQAGAEAKQKGQDVGTAIFNGVKNVGYMLGTKQYLSGMNSFMSDITSKDAEDVSSPTDIGNAANRDKVVRKILPSVAVPSIAKDAGVVINTLRGKPRVMADTAMEAARRRSGFTDGMVPELNTFGEEVTHPMEGKVNDDPAYALAEKFPPPPVDRTIEGVKLTQQQYHDLKQNVGQQLKAAYTAMADSPTFMKSPESVQQIILEKLSANASKIGSIPEKVRELQSDPLYYNRKLRILLNIQKPGGERHFPYVK